MVSQIDNVKEEDLKSIDKDLDTKSIVLSDAEIEEWLSEPLEEEDYADSKINTVRQVRAQLQFWHDLNNQLSIAREGYTLARKWDDEKLKERYIKEGGPLVKKMKILEARLKEYLPLLKNVQFLRQEELQLLPKWILKLLNVRIEENANS